MEPDDILFGGAETYEEKNDDYGDSWRKIGEILYMLAGEQSISLDSPEDHISYGLFTRRLDKLARAFNGEFVADEMNFESVRDAHEDEMVYAAMHASNQEDREPAPRDPLSTMREKLLDDVTIDTSTNGTTNLDSINTGGQNISLPPRSSTPREDEQPRPEDRTEDSGE